jgi:hypothetical protein
MLELFVQNISNEDVSKLLKNSEVSTNSYTAYVF